MLKKMISIMLCVMMAVGMIGCAAEPAAPAAPVESAAPAAPAAPAESAAESELAAEPAEEAGGFNYDAAGPVLKQIYDSGKLVAAVSGNNPPKVFTVIGEDGSIQDEGFETNMMRGLCSELSTIMGKEITLELMVVDGAASNLAALQGGKAQVGVSLAPTAERLESWDFTNTYFKSLKVFVHLRETEGDPMWDFENQLTGVTVGGILGSSDADACMLQYPGCEMELYNGYGDVLLAGLNGKVDCFLTTEPNALLYCSANPELMIEEAFTFESSDEIDKGACLAFAYGNEDFKAIANEYIARIRSDGTLNGYYNDALELMNVAEMYEKYQKSNLLNN